METPMTTIIVVKKMPNSHSDLFGEDEEQPVAPPAHSDLFILWALCIVVLAVVGIPTGLLAVRNMRADRNLTVRKPLPGALPFQDRYVAPAQLRCDLPDEPANLTFDLFKQYNGAAVGRGGGGIAVAGSKSATQVFCYYNKSRVSWLQGGKTWFGVASIPFSLCRYVIYGPVKLDGWTARVTPTARDIILIGQLASTVASFTSGNIPLLVYFAANLLEWTLEHGFAGVHLDWRGLDSRLCGLPGNDIALQALLQELRHLAKLNRVPLVVALSASAVPAVPGDLVDFYLLDGDQRCAEPDEAGLDSLYRKLRESEASVYSICWTVSAAVELFERRTVGIKGHQLRFSGLVPRSEVCDVPVNGKFRECSVGELQPREKGGKPAVIRYRTADGVAQSVRHYAKVWKGLDLREDPMCALYLDGDLDDPEGECGDPFPLLRALIASRDAVV
ncbi:hypothetical protein HPB52_017575 [Rhipicephalus sanguineus]|uniref:GH18 domain-containing protein n=1 Tax=Rhipicephalus sanguineus TaxID=34632 RepID=A0A9D4PK63_RHISA|nr:hypothetical protein HPB52_017575 [Rhipicephalus sanguineus]